MKKRRKRRQRKKKNMMTISEAIKARKAETEKRWKVACGRYHSLSPEEKFVVDKIYNPIRTVIYEKLTADGITNHDFTEYSNALEYAMEGKHYTPFSDSHITKGLKSAAEEYDQAMLAAEILEQWRE